MKPQTFKPGDSFTIDPSDVESAVTIPLVSDDQKKLKRLIKRRHPLYEELSQHWEFCEGTYEGGREWFEKNIFRYMKEGDQEYRARVERAYRFNHTREVVDLLNKYLFKQNITRNEADAPEIVKAFWKRSTRQGLAIKDLAKQLSRRNSIFGRVGVIVDAPAQDTPLSVAEEKEANLTPYAWIVLPRQLLDYAFDDQGELLWALIAECRRDDEDPMESSGAEDFVYRLWTRFDWRLFEVVKQGKKEVVVEIANSFHNLGEVPLVLADNVINDEPYKSPSLIDDIAYLDRAVGNYLSNLDAIIQDQSFSQLAMPAQNLLPGDDNYNKMLEMGTKRVFLYDGESKMAPEYLSPDPKQAELIITAINKIINEIYHTVGLAGERTKQDNALGIDNSSGVAKAYDFERVNALLAAKADALEVIENKIARLVAKWGGQTIKKDLVTYPENFDTRGLYDELDLSARLMLIMAPETARRQQMEGLIDKLFPQLAADLKAKMLAELKSWPPAMPMDANGQMLTSTSARTISKESLSTPGTPGQGSVK